MRGRGCWRSCAIAGWSRVADPRRKATLDEEEARIEAMASDVPGPEESAIDASHGRRLKVIMALLPDEFREVLVLREMEDFSYQQIAEALNIPIGTVMSRLARARGMLRDKWPRGRRSMNCPEIAAHPSLFGRGAGCPGFCRRRAAS